MDEKNKNPNTGTEKKPFKEGEKAKRTRNKEIMTIQIDGKNVNIDMVIAEIRKVMPMNRTRLKTIALSELLRGRSVQDIAKIAMTYRKSSDIGELSNTKIVE